MIFLTDQVFLRSSGHTHLVPANIRRESRTQQSYRREYAPLQRVWTVQAAGTGNLHRYPRESLPVLVGREFVLTLILLHLPSPADLSALYIGALYPKMIEDHVG